MASVQFRIPANERKDLDQLCKRVAMSRPLFFRTIVASCIRGDIVVRTEAKGLAVDKGEIE